MRVVYCTCPKEESESLAEKLLTDKLVACVNIIDQVKSIYWWEGKIQKDTESLLIMKTQTDLINKLINKIKYYHSYDVPEIISFEIKEGNEDYLSWIEQVT